MDTSNRQNDLTDKIEGASQSAQETLGQVGDTIAQKTDNLQAGISAATEAAQNMLQAAGEQMTEYAKATDEAIRKHPYQALGIALGVGLLAGYLIKRK